jgi:hypothetical protein
MIAALMGFLPNTKNAIVKQIAVARWLRGGLSFDFEEQG